MISLVWANARNTPGIAAQAAPAAAPATIIAGTITSRRLIGEVAARCPAAPIAPR